VTKFKQSLDKFFVPHQVFTLVNTGFYVSFVYTLCKQKPVLTKLRLGKVYIKPSVYQVLTLLKQVFVYNLSKQNLSKQNDKGSKILKSVKNIFENKELIYKRKSSIL
jgi:hypothetical protein